MVKKRSVGVQILIFRSRIQENLPGVLDAVAAAGYDGVETGFLGPQISGRDFKKLLDERGLVHVGAHYLGNQTDTLPPVIDWLGETGAKDLPISDLETKELSLDLYQKKAEVYNAAGELCKKAGIHLSYHNHSWEFGKIGNEMALELLYRLTDPQLVKLCIDTYWVRDGGGDPAAFVARHGQRLRILHCKDSYLPETGQRSFAPLGQGVLDFPAIFKALGPSPAPWVVTEEDVVRPDTAPEAEITLSRNYLRDVINI